MEAAAQAVLEVPEVRGVEGNRRLHWKRYVEAPEAAVDIRCSLEERRVESRRNRSGTA